MVVQSQFIEMFGQISDTTPRYEVKKLSDCCSYISDGSHFSPAEDSSGPYPMLSVKDMTENGFVYYDCKYISKKDFDVLVSNGCQPHLNDVLVAKDGSYFKYSFVVTEDKDQAILSSIAILRPKTDVLDPRYLAYYMLTDAVIQLVEKNYLTGTAIRRVILKGFKEIPTIIPPMELQKSFVSVLGQADKSKFGGLKSQFISQFGFPQDGAEKYPSATIESLLQETISGEWGTDCSDDSRTKVIRTTNFTNEGVLDLTDVVVRTIDAKKVEKKQLKKGDIILEKSGGTKDNPVGRLVYFEEDGVFLANNFTQVLRPAEDINSRYLFAALYYLYQTHKPLIKGLGNQTNGIQNLKVPQYLQLQISVPDRIAQDDFERICRQADKSKYLS